MQIANFDCPSCHAKGEPQEYRNGHYVMACCNKVCEYDDYWLASDPDKLSAGGKRLSAPQDCDFGCPAIATHVTSDGKKICTEHVNSQATIGFTFEKLANSINQSAERTAMGDEQAMIYNVIYQHEAGTDVWPCASMERAKKLVADVLKDNVFELYDDEAESKVMALVESGDVMKASRFYTSSLEENSHKFEMLYIESSALLK